MHHEATTLLVVDEEYQSDLVNEVEPVPIATEPPDEPVVRVLPNATRLGFAKGSWTTRGCY